MRNLTINLSKEEVESILRTNISKEFPGFTISNITFSMKSIGYDIRNESLGEELKDVKIELEKAYLAGRDNI